MQLVNLTPHEIRILNEDGAVIVPPSGNVARVATFQRHLKSVGGVDFYAQETGEVTGLPAPSRDTIYIVSALIRLAFPERRDLASPGDLIRDESGRPTGCRGLIVNQR